MKKAKNKKQTKVEFFSHVSHLAQSFKIIKFVIKFLKIKRLIHIRSILANFIFHETNPKIEHRNHSILYGDFFPIKLFPILRTSNPNMIEIKN